MTHNDPILNAFQKKIHDRLEKMSTNDMIEMAAVIAILAAGGNNKLAVAQQADIARAWLNAHYFSAAKDMIKFIATEIVNENLNLPQVKKLIAAAGSVAQENCEKLSTRAITLSDVLTQTEEKSK